MAATPEVLRLVAQLRSRRRRPAERLAFARNALTHGNAVVRSEAVECLASLGPPGLERTLIQRLSDRSWLVRVTALEALQNVLTPGCRIPPQLFRLLNDSSMLVRVQAAE